MTARSEQTSMSLTAFSVFGSCSLQFHTLCRTYKVLQSAEMCSPTFKPRASPIRSPLPASLSDICRLHLRYGPEFSGDAQSADCLAPQHYLILRREGLPPRNLHQVR